MTKKKSKSKAKFITPPNILRQKIGYGGLPTAQLEKAQTFLEKVEVNFPLIAKRFLSALADAVKGARSGKLNTDDALLVMTDAAMELKANGGMFGYRLVTEISGVILNFLETIDELNDDALDLIEAHYQTLNVIVANDLKGTGGKEGRALAQELYDACNRYYKKYDMDA